VRKADNLPPSCAVVTKSGNLNFLEPLGHSGGPGSSFSIVTDYGLEDLGSNASGDEIFCPSRPALGPNQPPVKWIPGLAQGGKVWLGCAADHSPILVPWSWKSRAIPLPILWATLGL